MFRRSMCLLSNYRQLLCSAEGREFVRKVNETVSEVKRGQSEADSKLMSWWEGVSAAGQRAEDRERELEMTKEMASKEEGDMKTLAEEEALQVEEHYEEALEQLSFAIAIPNSFDVLTKCQMEFASGAGGQEAMLFTGELLEMYARYAAFRGWKWDVFENDTVGLGGTRSALVAVEGPGSYAALRFEAGVHRVQRIPVTDKSRMHTSTASVAVLPEPEDVTVEVPTESVKIETMRASGPGGQNINKRSTAVRITHKDTGISVRAMDERHQHLNIQIAFKRLAAILMQQKLDKISEKTVSSRKIQVGSRARAEKIRTYNFMRDFVVDHRVQLQINNVEEVMRGEEKLYTITQALERQYRLDTLASIIKSGDIRNL